MSQINEEINAKFYQGWISITFYNISHAGFSKCSPIIFFQCFKNFTEFCFIVVIESILMKAIFYTIKDFPSETTILLEQLII